MENNFLERREEYTLQNLNRIFQVLQKFNVILSDQEKFIADQFFCSIDFADQIIQAELIKDAPKNILAFITGEKDTLESIPDNVIKNFKFIKEFIEQQKAISKFKTYACDILYYRSLLPKISNMKDYFRVCSKEVIAYTKMGIIFFPKNKLNSKAIHFLILMNLIGRLADNLIDLQEDYKNGRIIKLPRWYLRISLKISLLFLTIKTFLIIPKKSKVIKIGLRYLYFSLIK